MFGFYIFKLAPGLILEMRYTMFCTDCLKRTDARQKKQLFKSNIEGTYLDFSFFPASMNC